LAKTLLVRSVAQAFHLDFSRIQFTPDLMPADITGTEILSDHEGRRELRFVQGPIFANVILADEINRTPPKTQSALLEAMQEHQVTAAGKRYPLPKPFFVLATQNPIEMEGTYPLPEAQLDRFMFNVLIDYLPFEDELKVVLDTTSQSPQTIEALFDQNDISQFQGLVRRVPIAKEIASYAVKLVGATRPGQPETKDWINHSITWGAGLRAAQMLVLGAKARALLHGNTHVRFEDIQALVAPVLRHRLLLSYKAEAEGLSVERVIERLLSDSEF
jgi:MoxR-like ATPase